MFKLFYFLIAINFFGKKIARFPADAFFTTHHNKIVYQKRNPDVNPVTNLEYCVFQMTDIGFFGQLINYHRHYVNLERGIE